MSRCREWIDQRRLHFGRATPMMREVQRKIDNPEYVGLNLAKRVDTEPVDTKGTHPMTAPIGSRVIKKPVPLLFKPLKADGRGLAKAFAKASVHLGTGKVWEAGGDLGEALTALGLKNDVGGLAWLLVLRSLISAAYELANENKDLLGHLLPDTFDSFYNQLDTSLDGQEYALTSGFFARPGELPFVEYFSGAYKDWLVERGLDGSQAANIVRRLPRYFVDAMETEWRKASSVYAPIVEAMETPFSSAVKREQEWDAYRARLAKQIALPVFTETFGLKDIYVRLRAYYIEKNDRHNGEIAPQRSDDRKIVVDLEDCLKSWI